MSNLTPLSVENLYHPCDPKQFQIETSNELEDLTHMLGQERAVEAIEMGTGLNLQGFNLYVLGPPGTGRHSFIRQYLTDKSENETTPSDWCYVNNFAEPRKPRAIQLPAGRGRQFKENIERLIHEASTALITAFESEDYHNRRRSIEDQAQKEQENAFQEVQKQAQEAGLGIVQTVTGFSFVPLDKEGALKPEQYEKLPEKEQQRIQEETEKVSKELRKMLQAIPRKVRAVREKIDKLDREVALFAVGGLIEELQQDYSENDKVVAFLRDLKQDIADHVDMFTQVSNKGNHISKELLMGEEGAQDSSISRRYAVNLFVDQDDTEGAPVVFEDHPTHGYLVGQIEYEAKLGALTTDFTLLRPGALHKANGGYLVIDVRKILVEPYAWDALKHALKAKLIDIKSVAQAYSLISTVSLEPEPIPLNVKVVLIGNRQLYYLLQEYDPEFMELFKVAADFEEEMVRDEENTQKLARLIASIVRNEALHPLSPGGIARVIEESARHAGDAEMLSTRVRRIADIVREAHYWAGKNSQNIINAAEVDSAIRAQRRRMSRIHDNLMRETLRDTLLVDTEGETIGQINGLAVMHIGGYLFGRPNRISASATIGSGKVIDIEREVELGGPIHSKGVLILSRYLASRFTTDRPLSLSASLVFEQSYGPIDGDSASAAELCALLSQLSQVPIKQSLAITGSINQRGFVQAIGGVNEKIEGFFELCQKRGLNGTQGVIIPQSNVKHLMLRQDVVDAARENQFSIYAVNHVDDCMALLTGRDAGIADEQGEYPEDSINQLVKARLLAFSDKMVRLGKDNDDGPAKPD